MSSKATGTQPAHYVLSQNVFRRHLTASQKAVIATEILPFYEKENPQGRPEKGGKISTFNGKNRDKLGETIGVSGRYISDAKKLKQENPQGNRNDLTSGNISSSRNKQNRDKLGETIGVSGRQKAGITLGQKYPKVRDTINIQALRKNFLIAVKLATNSVKQLASQAVTWKRNIQYDYTCANCTLYLSRV